MRNTMHSLVHSLAPFIVIGLAERLRPYDRNKCFQRRDLPAVAQRASCAKQPDFGQAVRAPRGRVAA